MPDFETKCLLDIHDRLLSNPLEWKKLETHIRERNEMVRRGVLRCPTWFQEELNTLDSRLRAWWDAWNERWVIDRLQDEGVVERMTRVAREEGNTDVAQAILESASGILAKGAYYLTLFHFKPKPTLQLDRQLLAMLKRCDMQQFESPSAYLAQKRAEAAKQQQANEAKATDKVLEAVDSLSSKQLEQFVAVETAIATGDTITAHGSDAAYLERANAEKRQVLKEAEAADIRLQLDNPRAASNPGMHPRIYKRRRKAER